MVYSPFPLNLLATLCHAHVTPHLIVIPSVPPTVKTFCWRDLDLTLIVVEQVVDLTDCYCWRWCRAFPDFQTGVVVDSLLPDVGGPSCWPRCIVIVVCCYSVLLFIIITLWWLVIVVKPIIIIWWWALLIQRICWCVDERWLLFVEGVTTIVLEQPHHSYYLFSIPLGSGSQFLYSDDNFDPRTLALAVLPTPVLAFIRIEPSMLVDLIGNDIGHYYCCSWFNI